MTIQFENQKKDLAKTMTLKRERKKQNLTIRLREIAQERTSTMVKRQSAQMLKLFSEMKNELCTELRHELLKEKTENSDVSKLYSCKLDCITSTLQNIMWPCHLISLIKIFPHPTENFLSQNLSLVMNKQKMPKNVFVYSTAYTNFTYGQIIVKMSRVTENIYFFFQCKC